jgi:hypothetical protein
MIRTSMLNADDHFRFDVHLPALDLRPQTRRIRGYDDVDSYFG